jgi:hypothetical protein
MMRPKEHHPVSSAVYRLDGVTRRLGEVPVGQVVEGPPELGSQIIASRRMIRMPEDSNIGM